MEHTPRTLYGYAVGTRGVFWGAREVAKKPKRTLLKLRARPWALRVPRIHLPAVSHAKHSPLFSPEKGYFLAFAPGPLTALFGHKESEFTKCNLVHLKDRPPSYLGFQRDLSTRKID